jgi:hypothetical protein
MRGAFRSTTGRAVTHSSDLAVADARGRERRRALAARWTIAHPGDRPVVHWVVVKPAEVWSAILADEREGRAA